VPHTLKSVRKSAIVLSLYYAAVSAAIILFGSPLFRVLSFEYASLIALFGSLPVMWFAARYAQEHVKEKLTAILIPVWQAIGLAIIFPVILSLVFVRSCDLIYGLSYYARIVIPSSLIATIFGAFVGSLAKQKHTRILFVIGIWAITFIISLIPGYVSSQIFTYGWQYGYFPGFVWDDYIELDSDYYLATIGWLLVAIFVLFSQRDRNSGVKFWNPKSRRPWSILFFIAWIIYISEGGGSRGALSGLSHNKVEQLLNETFTSGSVTIHHNYYEFSDEKRTVLRYEIAEYLKEIQNLFPQVDTSMPIDVYLYPDSELLHEYVGTRRASIAKPWLGTLHIAQENLSSLKHELVHLLLKPYGNFPIYASWSTGLTEGAAVASEDDYDGLHTVDELSAWALQMKYASGVSPIMKFTGFAATASAASYLLTGSFSKYLLSTYGPEKYLSLYHTRDYEEIYGKTLEALDAEWKQATLAKSLPMSPSDSLMARYYFERSSIVNQACLRRIGRLLHEAREAYDKDHFRDAFELYKQVYSEDSTRIDALRGMVLAKLKEKRFLFVDAASIIYTSSMMKKPQGKVLLSSLAGDMLYLAFSAKSTMKTFYDDAIKYAPNDNRYVSAVGLRMLLEDSIFNVKKFLFFRYGLDTVESKIPQALYEHAWESQMPDSVRVGYIILRTLFNENRGEYSAAIHEWTALPVFVDPDKLSPTVRKAYDIMDKKVKRWMQALNLP
jgi:hypothetical protein